MHELSLCQAIADTVHAHSDGQRVLGVTVRIGYLRQVVPDSLQFYWEMVATGSELAGVELEVDHVPAVIECNACGRTTTLDMPVLLCGHCDGADINIVSGNEFLIASLDRAEQVS